MNRVDGKVALVTGGARGMGEATAKLLAEAGAKVVVTDVLTAEGKAVADAIEAAGGMAHFVRHDVTSEDDWALAVGEAVTRYGGLHVVVNNAGVWGRNETEATTLDTFDWIVGINLKGVFLGCKHAIGVMKNIPAEADAGAIVNFSSTAGMVGSSRAPLYSMTKGGVRLLTKSVALEVAERGYNIRCNSIHPGMVATPMQEEIFATSNMSEEEVRRYVGTRNPLGRDAEPIELARAVLFLASSDSAFMTGTELVVDGGYTAR